ncbi:MAG: DoxX family protein [Muribaculaceae bacterium]|nr:DoxX family protein [Bacteroides sp.]MDE6071158.1 DoxX family protein [Muribaculaceae bacterium]
MMNAFKKIYICTTGYSYTNMGRLFLRLFVGIMLMQFGIKQCYNFDAAASVFPEICGLSSTAGLTVMICIEIICSFFIMCGFMTRIMTVPPFIAMIVAEYYILHDLIKEAPYMLSWAHQGYVPIMFLGIYFFIMLVGPGKISVDYFLSLYFIHSHDHSESELEEV